MRFGVLERISPKRVFHSSSCIPEGCVRGYELREVTVDVGRTHGQWQCTSKTCWPKQKQNSRFCTHQRTHAAQCGITDFAKALHGLCKKRTAHKGRRKCRFLQVKLQNSDCEYLPPSTSIPPPSTAVHPTFDENTACRQCTTAQ